jgi:CDP-diacylglycerol--glycerol-3-phosphate 3-phosphatidyltransferase
VTVPNALSLLRIALVPLLLALAAGGYTYAFTALLALSFATDVLDGFLARRLGQTSTLGAQLDSWGDFAVYASLPLCAWWLVPDAFARNVTFFALIAGSVLVPPVIALLKFRRASAYHTWLVKIAALLVGVSLIVLFAGGLEWPLRLATPVSVIAAAEEIAITCVLRAPASNVRSLCHALGLE